MLTLNQGATFRYLLHIFIKIFVSFISIFNAKYIIFNTHESQYHKQSYTLFLIGFPNLRVQIS